VPDRLALAAERVARILPHEIATRVFVPSWHEAERRQAVGRRRARSWWRRAALRGLLFLTLVRLAVQSLRIALADRRSRRRLELSHTSHPGVDPMLLQDLRFAARILWKKPGFSLTAVAVLALSIGANTAIFSIVQGVLLHQLPFDNPDRIFRINETNARGPITVSPPNFVDWQAQNRTFDVMAPYYDLVVTLSGDAAPERVDALRAGAGFFDVLGTRPLLGRTFTADEVVPNGPPVVILGHDLWRGRFGGSPAIVGTSIIVEARPHQVVGVMPRGFAYPDGYELWLPLVFQPSELRPNQRGAHYIGVIGRLKPGHTREQAQEDIAAIEARLATEYPQVQGYGIWVEPILNAIVGEYRRPLWMLFGAVLCVLLIGCANISNLLLARGASRRTEIGIRTALGAGRWRIVRQLLAESTMLAIAGGVAGLVLALWSSRALGALLPADMPRDAAVALDSGVLLFTLVVSVTGGILFGIAPALEASRGDLVTSLKDGRRDGASGPRRGLRGVLVAAEVALALVLLAGAGLALRSFDRLAGVETGFDAKGTLVMDLVLPQATYPDGPSIVRFYEQYIEGLSSRPGIVAAGAVAIPPLARGGYGGTFTQIGRPEPEEEPRMQVRAATPGYLEAVRVPLLRGRLITSADRATAPHVAVISESAARQYWPGEDPVGQRIRLHVGAVAPEVEREVVGVVGDVRGRIETAPLPLVYVPHAQYPFEFMTVFVRTAGDAMSAAPMVRAQLSGIDPEIAIGSLRQGDTLVSIALAQPRFRMVLLAAFAATALALAALGLYGVMSFLVNQRRSEIGLRIALGAGRGEVVALILRQGMVPVVAGMVAGLAGAYFLTGVMRGLLFGVKPFDPLTFGSVSLLLAAVATLACYLPANRAARVDPLIALRTD
jgi:putative ABC transport system permease protein